MRGRTLAVVFVLLWSTGFISTRLAAPHSGALSFLFVRFALVVCAIAPFALLAGRRAWPASRRQIGHVAVAGLLIQFGYLGGVFVAIYRGMPAATAALIVGLQPILTALAGRVIGERVRAVQWLGLSLGFAGVTLVVSQRSRLGGFDAQTLVFNVLSLLSITAGTLYQRRFCRTGDLRGQSVIQFAAAGLAALPFAVAEGFDVRFTPALLLALVWSVLVLSLGAVTLLMVLLRSGTATSVSSLFYLVPPVTAVMAYIGFGDRLTPLAFAGFAVVAVGVAISLREPAT